MLTSIFVRANNPQNQLRKVLFRCSHVVTSNDGSSIGRTFSASSGKDDGTNIMYFHISPSGDWWTGPSIFAAKHLQPDYVKSIPIPAGFDPNKYFSENEEESENELSWEDQQRLLHQIYDEGKLPSHLLNNTTSPKEDDNQSSPM